MTGQRVFLVFVIKGGQYETALCFSTFQKASDWATKDGCQYIITDRVIDHPEIHTEAVQ